MAKHTGRASAGPRGRPRIGLALGSGSARGWAHIGVIQRLVEAGVPIDYVAGASIGAFVGAAFCAGQLERLAQQARRLDWRQMANMLDMVLPRAGLLAGTKIAHFLHRLVGDCPIEDLSVPFCAVATNLHTGREIWMRRGSTVEAVRASLSIPGIFTPVHREAVWLVDGGLTNPVPVSACRAMGADLVIAVHLNAEILSRPRRPAVTETPDVPSQQARRLGRAFRQHWQTQRERIRERLPLLKRSKRDPVSIFEVLLYSVQVMQDRIAGQRLAADPPDLLITPALRHVLLWEFHRADECIAEGAQAAEAALPRLQAVLQPEGLSG